MLESFRHISLSLRLSLSREQQAGLEEPNDQLKILQSRYTEFAALQLSDSKVNLLIIFYSITFSSLSTSR